MSEPASKVGAAPERRRYLRTMVNVCCVLGILFILFFLFANGGASVGILRNPSSTWFQQVHTIGLCLFQYSVDHDFKYPDGNSSTEVFQKLLDGGYTSDPTIFYIPLPGKTKPIPGQKLKPENVCFDVTCCVDPNAPDELPVVFMTGYKISYVPGGAAVPIIKPYPHFGTEPRTWTQWFNHEPPERPGPPGIAVLYKSNNATFLKLDTTSNPDGSVPNFVPLDFRPNGRTYRQLTPGGPLP